MNKLKYGLIGLGARGKMLLEDELLPLVKSGRVELSCVCDEYLDRAKTAEKIIFDATGKAPFVTTDYEEVINQDIDAVIIMTAWEAHIDIAVDAMTAGKAVGMEVGGAYSIEDCWRLVYTYEKTKSPFMLLENCCFGKRELMVFNMVKSGILGNIVAASGGYHHDLREEVANGEENRHYRLRNYLGRNCENYPTHELGPIAKVLGINNGNRMLTLSSQASCSKGVHDYIISRNGEDHKLADVSFAQGDIVNTVIKCAGGELITLTLDTTLPRAYSRGFTVRGTKGSYFEDTDSVFLDGVDNENHDKPKKLWGNAEKYEEKYLHDIWRDFVVEGGHDGIDKLTFEVFTSSLENKTPMPIDVYDAASYMAVSVLSEQSVSLGGTALPIPDFTRGKWLDRKDKAGDMFNLK